MNPSKWFERLVLSILLSTGLSTGVIPVNFVSNCDTSVSSRCGSFVLNLNNSEVVLFVDVRSLDESLKSNKFRILGGGGGRRDG